MYRRRRRGTTSTTRSDTTASASITVSVDGPDDEVLLELPELLELCTGWVKPGRRDSEITTSRITCTTNPLKLSTIPIETAAPDSTPNLWKNRTSMAIRAAVAGSTSAMNCRAY